MLELEKVEPERTYHRSLDISLRHRCWGANVPAVGLNFLEVDRNGKPVAVITYKRAQNPWSTMQFTLKVHANAALMMNIPHFIVQYDFNQPSPSYFITAMNVLAERYIPNASIIEEPWLVRLLHLLRGIVVSEKSEGIMEQINQRWSVISTQKGE